MLVVVICCIIFVGLGGSISASTWHGHYSNNFQVTCFTFYSFGIWWKLGVLFQLEILRRNCECGSSQVWWKLYWCENMSFSEGQSEDSIIWMYLWLTIISSCTSRWDEVSISDELGSVSSRCVHIWKQQQWETPLLISTWGSLCCELSVYNIVNIPDYEGIKTVWGGAL